jgi:hypothetical protein
MRIKYETYSLQKTSRYDCQSPTLQIERRRMAHPENVIGALFEADPETESGAKYLSC